MIGDYWIVHRGRVDVRAMYDPHGRYSYWHGIVCLFFLIAFYLELVLNGTLIELACACGYAGYFTSVLARSSSCYQSEYQDQRWSKKHLQYLVALRRMCLCAILLLSISSDGG